MPHLMRRSIYSSQFIYGSYLWRRAAVWASLSRRPSPRAQSLVALCALRGLKIASSIIQGWDVRVEPNVVCHMCKSRSASK
jgi:hypothetical protein